MKERFPEIVFTGLGVTAAIGQGRSAFLSALLEGRHRFGVMKRPGRQQVGGERVVSFLGAEIENLALPESLQKGALRTASLSSQVALATLDEAWRDARLGEVAPDRIGLVVGGSNFQQRELVQIQESYRGRLPFLRPSYGMSFMDSDLCGICTELFGIRGFAYTLGGASASGLIAVLQAANAVRSGSVDACIALGALADISCWECQGFRSLGGMGSDRYAKDPEMACRPFDRERDGFIYGESCGAVVLEKAGASPRTGVTPYARLAGGAIAMDGNRNPNPSLEGEVGVVAKALADAGLSASKIDYVNPHGTGSMLGDEIELEAIKVSGLSHAALNATKSVTGHGLSAAGTVEVIATILQMNEGLLHPTRNLENPIDPSLGWVRDKPIAHAIDAALTLSMGFGGMNSAACIARCS